MDDVCLLPRTSGITGPPKGVMGTHANLTWNVANFLWGAAADGESGSWIRRGRWWGRGRSASCWCAVPTSWPKTGGDPKATRERPGSRRLAADRRRGTKRPGRVGLDPGSGRRPLPVQGPTPSTPGEVEPVLTSHPAVADAGIVLSPRGRGRGGGGGRRRGASGRVEGDRTGDPGLRPGTPGRPPSARLAQVRGSPAAESGGNAATRPARGPRPSFQSHLRRFPQAIVASLVCT
jgi:hypothetical protein